MATEKKKEFIITGVPEVDEKLGGGIPLGSLCLVEGHSDAGKSVLCQHLTNGTLIIGEIAVAYYTTENAVKSLISQMDSLALRVMDHFLADRLRIFPLTFNAGMTGGQKPFHVLTHHFSQLPHDFKLIIVAYLSHLPTGRAKTLLRDDTPFRRIAQAYQADNSGFNNSTGFTQ